METNDNHDQAMLLMLKTQLEELVTKLGYPDVNGWSPSIGIEMQGSQVNFVFTDDKSKEWFAKYVGNTVEESPKAPEITRWKPFKNREERRKAKKS